MVKFLEYEEFDRKTMEFTNGKLRVKADPNGGLVVGEDGIKVTFPETVTSVKDITIDTTANQIVVTLTNGQVERKDLPALPVDVSLGDATLTEDRKLRLVLTNDRVFEVELHELIPPIKTAQQIWDEIKVLPNFRADLITILKGEEAFDFNDNLKGFFLPLE